MKNKRETNIASEWQQGDVVVEREKSNFKYAKLTMYVNYAKGDHFFPEYNGEPLRKSDYDNITALKRENEELKRAAGRTL